MSLATSRDAASAERTAEDRLRAIRAAVDVLPDCLTVYDDYGKPVNSIAHAVLQLLH